MVNRERGHTLMQVVIAISMLTILSGAALSGGNSHFTTIGRAYDELRASEAAADRLEAIAADDAAPTIGERGFEAGPGMEGTETIAEVRPGLYEVRVRVTKPGARPAILTTLVAREVRR